MFTQKTLSLAKLHGRFGLVVQRDCEFSYVGKVPTNLNKRIVPCTKPIHIEQAIAAEGVVAIVTQDSLISLVPNSMGLATSQDPLHTALSLQAYIAELEDFQWESFESDIHPSAVIHDGAVVSPRDVLIGEGSVIHSNAVILPRTVIGRFCSIGPGSIVSTDAFDLDTSCDPYRVVSQSGGVRISDYVDIQAKCTIVRATFGGFTELGEGTKLDCQVHFAHDCISGRNVRIAACAEISGRVRIGDRTFVGPNCSISNGIVIGKDARITIGAVVTRDVTAGETVTGNFAVNHRKWISFMRSLK